MEKLFSYGTLQMQSVQQSLFGRILNGTKDTLVGYVVSEVIIKDKSVIEKSGTDRHPILKKTGNPADEVSGHVFEVTYDELMQADAYEVDEYIRVNAEFKSGIMAWVYADASSQEHT